MKYCSNCGRSIADNASFCTYCGSPTIAGRYGFNRQEQRIVRCPNCGYGIGALMIVCPSCGSYIPNDKPVQSVQELANRLNEIEARRVVIPQKRRLGQEQAKGDVSLTDKQKASLIESFAIPNTKEDLVEFIILASSNIDTRFFEGQVERNRHYSDSEFVSGEAVAHAWYAKMEQAYHKAKISFGNDADFQEVRKIYEETQRKVEHAKGEYKRETRRVLIIFFAVHIGIVLLLVISKLF